MPAAERNATHNARRYAAYALSAIALFATPRWLAAQAYRPLPTVQTEWRADVLGGPPLGVQLGAGLNIPAGIYLRLGVAAAGGVSWINSSQARSSARADVTVRYLLDPFGELRWGMYGGAGMSARVEDGKTRAYLLIIGGIEGPAFHGWRTSFEAGLGGGARVGIVLRRARKNGR